MSKKGSIFRIVINVLLVAVYLVLGYYILAMYPFIPWHDESGDYLLIYLALWIPVCALTLILVASIFISRRIYRARVILLCINAVFIPLVYLLGGVSPVIHYILGGLVLVTIAAYIATFIKSVIDKTV